MKRQTIIVILTVLILVGIVHANPYTKDKQDNVWEERFQQIIAQQEIQKEEYEKLKKSATQEVFYREYGSVSKSEETGIVTVENAGIFSIKVKGSEILKAGEKAVLTFYIGNMFKRGYFELEDYIDEMIDSTKVGLMKDGLLSFIVPQGKIYVDYNNIEIKKFLYDGAILPGNRKTPMKLIKKDNMQTTDPDNLIAYLEEWYFKVHKEETLGRYEEAMKKTIENAVSAVIGKVKGKIISEIAKKTTPAVGIAYTLGEISWPLINALLEDITENKIAIEKSKLDLLKIMAKDRNEYNIFDIPIVLNEKIIGTEDPIMAMIITIPIEVKAGFELGDKMGFYFDGCLGEKQDLERSEYYEWDLNEWGNLSGNDPVEAGEMLLVQAGTFTMGDTFGRGYSNENPTHQVTLTKDYYIGKYEVTNGEFVKFLNGANVTHDNGSGYIEGRRIIYQINRDIYLGYDCVWYVKDNYNSIPLNYAQMPVEWVTWWGAVEYCNWLSRQNGLEEAYEWDSSIGTYKLKDYPSNRGYRLPTEAEWEYAARGGHATGGTGNNWAGTSQESQLKDYAWYGSNSDIGDGTGRHAQTVGQKKPNELGIYNMSGNVCEWCSDNMYDYTAVAQTDPYFQGLINTDSSFRVVRGGNTEYSTNYLHVSFRKFSCGNGNLYVGKSDGFRLSRTR